MNPAVKKEGISFARRAGHPQGIAVSLIPLLDSLRSEYCHLSQIQNGSPYASLASVASVSPIDLGLFPYRGVTAAFTHSLPELQQLM